MVHFRRSGAPTRHLAVGNCGPAQANREALETLFASYDGTVTPGRGHMSFVSLPTTEAAAAVCAALQGTTHAWLPGSGPLSFKFAERDDGSEAAVPQLPLVAVRRAEECGIPGLTCHSDFVSAAEEVELVREADAQQHWQCLARRRVLHFGAAFDYEARDVGAAQQPIPPAARRVADRIEPLPGAVAVDQLTVNEYGPGVGIAPHVETHAAFNGAIASLCLGGPAVMVFRRDGQRARALFLPPRSLLIMADEARYAWQHYIPHRKSDLVAAAGGAGGAEAVPRARRRVSLTFRQVRRSPCICRWPEHCDSQLAPLAPTRAALKRMALEQQRTEGQQEAAGQQAEQREAEPQQAEQQAAEPQQAEEPAGAEASSGAHGGFGSPHAQEQQQRQQAGRPAGCAEVPPGPGAAPSAGAAPGEVGGDRQLAALEARYVHRVYDAIAPHFASTRFAVWPRVRAFLEGLPPAALVADVGCGNGKYFGVRRDGFVLGSDRSAGLAGVASRRLQAPPLGEGLRADVAVADGMVLPYRPGSCDGVLCIAVLHHIASPARRLAMLAQLLRVLRPGGRALVTVWATEQGNMNKVRSWRPVSEASGAAAGGDATGAVVVASSSTREAAPSRSSTAGVGTVVSGDYFVPWHLPFHRAEAAAAARAAGDGGSAAAPGRGCRPDDASARGDAAGPAAAAAAAAPRLDSAKGAVVFQRYYHLFERGELEGLVAQLPGAVLVESFYDKDNWCAVFQRMA